MTRDSTATDTTGTLFTETPSSETWSLKPDNTSSVNATQPTSLSTNVSTAQSSDSTSTPSADSSIAQENVAAILFVSLFILIALVGNSLVLLVFNWRWRSTGATKVYVLMLAGLDLVCTVLGTPRELWAAARWCINITYCNFTLFATYHLNFTSALVLTAIAVSRLVTEQGHGLRGQAKIKVRGQANAKGTTLKGVLVKVACATNTIRGAKIVCVVAVFLSFLPTWPTVVESWHDVEMSEECKMKDESKTLSCYGTMRRCLYLFHSVAFIVNTTVLVALYSAAVRRVWLNARDVRSTKSSIRSDSMDHQQRVFRGFLESDRECDSGSAPKSRSRSRNTPKLRSASDIKRYLRSDSYESCRFRSNFDARKLCPDFGDSEIKDCRSPISSQSEYCRTPLTSESEDCHQIRSASGDSRKFHADFGNPGISLESGPMFSRNAMRRISEAMSDTVFQSLLETPIKNNKRISVRMSEALSDTILQSSPEAPIKNSKRISVSSGALDLLRPAQGFQNFSVCRSLSDTVTRRNRRKELTPNSDETKFSNFPPISYSTQQISSFNLTLSGNYGCSDSGLFRRTSTSSFQFSKHGNRAKQTTLVFLCITIIYIVSYLPYFAITLANKFDVGMDKTVSDVFLRSHLLANVLNPLVYGFCNPYFRSTVWKILTRRRVII